MRVRNLMSSPAVTVAADASLREVAAVLAEHGISGVPVVAGGSLIGVVSESDIVDKECGPEKGQEPVPRLPRRRSERARPCPTTAGEAMTSPALVVEPWMSAYQAAWLMSTHDVNRLPVVERERVVGVITRRDLVRHFARPDLEIEREVVHSIEAYDREALEAGHVRVQVEKGRVKLEGEIKETCDLAVLPRIAARVPGVLAVDTDLCARGRRGVRRGRRPVFRP
jgi:CBS domain-containing protein